jgi:hypothetical protein
MPPAQFPVTLNTPGYGLSALVAFSSKLTSDLEHHVVGIVLLRSEVRGEAKRSVIGTHAVVRALQYCTVLEPRQLQGQLALSPCVHMGPIVSERETLRRGQGRGAVFTKKSAHGTRLRDARELPYCAQNWDVFT